LTQKPPWAYNMDFLTQAIRPESIVLRPEFKPQVIDGGKQE